MSTLTTEAPTSTSITAELIDSIDVHDSHVLDNRTERFHLALGPIDFEVSCDNAGQVSAALVRLADRILAGAIDAADDFRIRTGHKCACGIWLDRDDPSCGNTRCEIEMGLF